jgi:hypothetical protein
MNTRQFLEAEERGDEIRLPQCGKNIPRRPKDKDRPKKDKLPKRPMGQD